MVTTNAIMNIFVIINDIVMHINIIVVMQIIVD